MGAHRGDEHAAAYEEAPASLMLGQMVHDRRVELGLTRAELAERAGMTQPQLSRLESGGATPTAPLLARLAAALNFVTVMCRLEEIHPGRATPGISTRLFAF
jgi:transcriptional regulator with XRE-family HTH domain